VASLVTLAAEQALRFPALPAWRAVHAQALAGSGDVAGALELARTTLDLIENTAVDPLRQISLALLVDVAARGGDVELAAQLEELLAPDVGRWATVAQMVGSFGAVAHHVGVAAAVAGHLDRAVEALDRAVEQHRGMRAPTWELRSLVELVVALERRGTAADLRRAATTREQARLLALRCDRQDLLAEPLVATRREELAVG
jgi:hypothetical protein